MEWTKSKWNQCFSSLYLISFVPLSGNKNPLLLSLCIWCFLNSFFFFLWTKDIFKIEQLSGFRCILRHILSMWFCQKLSFEKSLWSWKSPNPASSITLRVFVALRPTRGVNIEWLTLLSTTENLLFRTSKLRDRERDQERKNWIFWYFQQKCLIPF